MVQFTNFEDNGSNDELPNIFTVHSRYGLKRAAKGVCVGAAGLVAFRYAPELIIDGTNSLSDTLATPEGELSNLDTIKQLGQIGITFTGILAAYASGLAGVVGTVYGSVVTVDGLLISAESALFKMASQGPNSSDGLNVLEIIRSQMPSSIDKNN